MTLYEKWGPYGILKRSV